MISGLDFLLILIRGSCIFALYLVFYLLLASKAEKALLFGGKWNCLENSPENRLSTEPNLS